MSGNKARIYGGVIMYLEYKRIDGVIESCVYRKCFDGTIEVAIEGDFRKGYITYTKEEFEKRFISKAIKILKHKSKQ